MKKCDVCKCLTSKVFEFHEDEWTIYELCNDCAVHYDDDVGISGVYRARRRK